MSESPTNPALRYYGGKFRLGRWIAEHFPAHMTYVEPFGGAAGVSTTECPVERARRYFVRSWQSFGGPSLVKTGWKRQKALWVRNPRIHQIREWSNAVRNLAVVARRFMQVQIEHDDALKVIARYDSPETLFYCDPPYPDTTRSENWGRRAYTHEFSQQDHVHLANALKLVKGMALVSTYPNELYRELFEGWAVLETTCQTMNKTVATECLYLSPATAERLGLK
jgi:DNA adenine methylase